MCLCCSLLNNAQLRSTTLNSTQHDFAPLCSIGVFLCFAVQNWAALNKRSTAYYLTLLYRDVSLLDRAVQYNTIQNHNKHYFASIHFGKVVQLHFIWMLSSPYFTTLSLMQLNHTKLHRTVLEGWGGRVKQRIPLRTSARSPIYTYFLSVILYRP